jgi:SAM-dependent methyltransferase
MRSGKIIPRMSNSNYSGMMAEHYDEIYKNKPYGEEALFIHQQIEKNFNSKKVSILELACGSGNHSLNLAKYNHDITATDISAESIEIAKKKNSYPNLRFETMDMAKPVDRGKFDVVICLFDSIGYLLENNLISRLFQYVKSSLVTDGLFIYEYWHAGAFLRNYEAHKYRFIEDINLHRISLTQIDYVKQLASVNFRFFQNGSYYEETHRNRFFLCQEMSLFLETNQFELLDRYDAYSESTEITDTTWHILDVTKPK